MQNQYVGDIGDYGEYGLLRALFSKGGTDKLGVVWYLVPDEVHKNDGRHIDYLNTFRFKGCDPELFNALKVLVRDGVRKVSEVENLQLFQDDTGVVPMVVGGLLATPLVHSLCHLQFFVNTCLFIHLFELGIQHP